MISINSIKMYLNSKLCTSLIFSIGIGPESLDQVMPENA